MTNMELIMELIMDLILFLADLKSMHRESESLAASKPPNCVSTPNPPFLPPPPSCSLARSLSHAQVSIYLSPSPPTSRTPASHAPYPRPLPRLSLSAGPPLPGGAAGDTAGVTGGISVCTHGRVTGYPRQGYALPWLVTLPWLGRCDGEAGGFRGRR